MERQPNESMKSTLNPEMMQELIKEGVIRISESEPFTVEDIEDFEDMILDDLPVEDLEDLLANAEDLYDRVQDSEPEDKNSAEYTEWETNISQIEAFIDEIQDHIDNMETGESITRSDDTRIILNI